MTRFTPHQFQQITLESHSEEDEVALRLSHFRFQKTFIRIGAGFTSVFNRKRSLFRSHLNPFQGYCSNIVRTSRYARRIGVCVVLFFLLGFIDTPQIFAYSMNMNASIVIGQPDFTSTSINQGLGGEGTNSIGANTLNAVNGAIIVGNKLIVSDYNNNRVLIWNSIPTRNNQPADVVIGQTNFSNNTGNRGGSCAANTLNRPGVPFSDGTRLFIPDSTNYRVLIFNNIPTSNGVNADVVIGQPNFTSCSVNQGGSVGANTLNIPAGGWIEGNKVLIVDAFNHRVLIFNSIPTSNNASADVVVGQTNFSSSSANQGGSAGANTINKPISLMVNNGKLFITDEVNNRILIWNSIPTVNNTSADVVVGQPNFTSSSANQGGSVGANTLHTPQGVWAYNNRLFTVEEGNAGANNRVMIFNSIPTSNNASADIVIGQPSFISTSINQGGSPGANNLNRPVWVYANSGKLIVVDRINHRLLIFNDTTNFPRLGLTSIGSSPDSLTQGRLRVYGNMYVDQGLYDIWKVETSVNGGDYASVASLDHSIQTNSNHDPGKTDTVTSSFYSDFEPWNLNNQSTGNGLKADWLSDFNSMLSTQGYLLKLKATNNNADSGFPLVYFLPFSIINPTNATSNPFSLSIPQSPLSPQSPSTATTGVLPVISSDPTITFKVNPNFRQEFKENIDQYQVWYQPLKYDPITKSVLPPMDTDWIKYIDSIPSDYDLVRDSELNKNQGSYDGTKDTGNGTYLTDTLSVKYTNNSSQITVKKIGNQDNTIPKEPVLNPGTYRLRVSAIDKHGHGEDTEAVVVVVK